MGEQNKNTKKSSGEYSNFFSLLLENSKIVGIILMDIHGKILSINQGITNSLGYSRNDLTNLNLSSLFTLEDRLKKLPEIELASVLLKGSSNDENYLLHQDGSPIWVHGESVLIKDNENPIIIKLIFDLNHKKLLEKFLVKSEMELVNKNEELNKIIKDLDTFVYTASHDLKGPLNNIDGLVSALYDELQDHIKGSADAINYKNLISESIEKFRQTLDDLASIGKNQQHETGLILFQEIVEDLQMEMRENIEKEEAEIICDFSEINGIKIPRKNIKSILYNLLSNAIKFRHPARKPVIRIKTFKVDDFVLLQVSDNGVGIKEEDRLRIFSLYERLDKKIEGTGVGMNLVARMVDNLGGKILIESEVGIGTTFNIFLKKQPD